MYICSSHRKYLSPFFCCIVSYYVESCIFYANIFFLHFSFFKKGRHRECNGIFEININFSYYLRTLDKDGLSLNPRPSPEWSYELGSACPFMLLSFCLEVDTLGSLVFSEIQHSIRGACVVVCDSQIF